MRLQDFIIAIATIVLPIGPCHAQGFKSALEKTQAFYDKEPYVAVYIKTELYKQIADPKPEKIIKAEVKKSKNDFLTQVSGKTFLNNERCAVIVDRDNLFISYSPPAPDVEKMKKLLNEFSSPDSILKSSVTVTELPGSEGVQSFSIVPKKQAYGINDPSKTVISLNVQNGSIKSIVYIFRPHPTNPYERIVISYTHKIGQEHVQQKDFAESRYITRKGNKVLPSEEFKNYKIVFPKSKDKTN